MRTRSTRPSHLENLVADIHAGKVELLVILGGNPVYDAPADLDFADALKNGKIPLRVHSGSIRTKPPNSVSGTSIGARTRSLGRCSRL